MIGDVIARHKDWMHIKTNLIWIYEGEILESVRQRVFPPGDLAAWLILEGQCELQAENITTKAGAGEWMLPWPGRRFQSFKKGSRLLSIRFQANWPDGRPLFDHGLSVTFPSGRHPELEVSARHLLDACAPFSLADPLGFRGAQLPFDAFLQIKAALLKWIVEYYQILTQLGIKPTRLGIGDDRVAEVLHYLDSMPLESRYHEMDVASQVGLSEGQLVRIFRQEIGETPRKYFEERRRDFARRMLAITNVPIKQVAHELGFIRLSDFSSWVNGFLKMSPREFRNTFSDTEEDSGL